MSMTRQNLLTRIRQMSDTLNATVDYPDELINDFAAMVHIDEWRGILGVNAYYRTALYTVPLDANRTFAWDALTSGTGKDIKRVYRVLEMTDAQGHDITPTQADRLRIANNASALATTVRLWTKVGDRVQVFGATGNVNVLVNWTPASVSELASDADIVDWPDEWRPLLYYETASMVLSKGGRETNEARELMQMAEKVRQRMLQAIGRDSASPMTLGANDSPWDWGG